MSTQKKGENNRWTEPELVTFFYSFKESGKKWDLIQQNLKNMNSERSISEIKELYKRNMGYLGLPTAKAKDFVTIINDYYKAIDDDSENSEEGAGQAETSHARGSGSKSKNDENDMYCVGKLQLAHL